MSIRGLTPSFRPKRGFYLSGFQLMGMTVRPILPLVIPERRGTFLPLLGGEGVKPRGATSLYGAGVRTGVKHFSAERELSPTRSASPKEWEARRSANYPFWALQPCYELRFARCFWFDLV